MAAKIGLIVAGIAGVAALGTGGYFANEWRVCSGLEEDYLDQIYSIRSTGRARALAASVGVKVNTREQQDLDQLTFELLGRQLDRLGERCGSDATKRVMRESENIMYAR